MDLKEIVLRQISTSEFRSIQEKWLGQSRSKANIAPARIVEPLVFPDYRSLIEDFISDEHAKELSVRSSEGWERYYRKQVKPDVLNRVCRLAEENTDFIGPIDLSFNFSGINSHNTQIGFTWYNGKVVSYYLDVHLVDRNNFSWVSPSHYNRFGKFLNALWLPE